MSNEQFVALKAGRIDKIVAETLDVSRNQVEKLVKDGLVSVNDKLITKTSYKVAEGDEITYMFKDCLLYTSPSPRDS